MDLKLITSKEIEQKIQELESKAVPLRNKVLKELDELSLLYKEVLDLKAELEKRVNEKK